MIIMSSEELINLAVDGTDKPDAQGTEIPAVGSYFSVLLVSVLVCLFMVLLIYTIKIRHQRHFQMTTQLQSPMKGEIFGLKAQLESLTTERNLLQEAVRKIQYRLKDKAASTLGLQAQNYEARLTELDCVIAELKRQLDYQRENIILEESTEDDNEMARDEEEDGGEILHQEELDEYPALPTLPEDIMSAPPAPFTSSSSTSTSSSSSSSATSKANSPDKPTAGGTGATPAVPVSKIPSSDTTKEKQHNRNRRNVNEEANDLAAVEDNEETEEDVKREPSRRISVTRSRRRNLQPSSCHNQISQKSRKAMDENRYYYSHHQQSPSSPQIQPKNKALQAGLTLRDLEMRAWRDGKSGAEGEKKTMDSLGNSVKQYQYHQYQQQQQQQIQQEQYQQHLIQQYYQLPPKQELLRHGGVVDPRAIVSREESEIICEKPRLSPDSVFQFAALRDEVAQIREEHFAIRETLFRKEGELDRTRSALENIAEERDFLKKKVYELEHLLKQSPKKFPQFMPVSSSSGAGSDVPALPMAGEEAAFTCKVAERVKLKQLSSSSSHNGSNGRTPHSTPSKRNPNVSSNKNSNNINNNNIQKNCNNNNNNEPECCHNNNEQPDCHHHHHHHHHLQSISLNMNSVVQVQQQQVKNHSKGTTSSTSGYISGQELVAAVGNSCSTRLAEHLVQPLQDDSTVAEIEQAFTQSPTGSIAEEKVREFEIETERLNSRLEHLRCQNDVLTLNLDDAKSHADRLTVLLGKYESNNVGHQIALGLSDQLIEAYDVLVALLESELGLLLANCRAAGIGASTHSGNNNSTQSNGSQPAEDDFDVASLLQRANENRMTAEIAARNILIRMVDSPGSENNNGMMLHLPIPHPATAGANNPPPTVPPWEDASSCSQTLSSASSVGESSSHSHGGSSGDAGGGPNGNNASRGTSTEKNEEPRVRDLIIQLKTDREAVRNTLVELENWSLEPQSPMQPNLSPCDILEARKLDLETAVLMQELMAMREDRAELRAQLFMIEREKTNLEFKLSSYEAQQDAYKARINHLKAELAELEGNTTATTTGCEMTGREITTDSSSGNLNENENSGTTGSTGDDSNVNNNNNQANNNTEREMTLKKRIQELAASLEKVAHNANLREHQSHETVNELKKANNILLENLETVKKKYQNRIRKMEEQIVAIVERHSVQMKLYKERVHLLEAEMMERTQHL